MIVSRSLRYAGVMALAPGDMVAGKYRIDRLLGEGGMGRVYVATHQILRKSVALKVMAERFVVDADAVERFFREAVASTKIDHPAIVIIFDADVHDGAPFMAMELLEGEDLEQRLAREGRLSLQETLRIARPVLSALDAAHRVGVIHRDIKPPNIFLARRPNGVVTPKLLDFGIAKHLNDPAFDRLTQTGSILGTPLYLPPEQARADSTIDHRADIYGMGVTLYHCLSGGTPWLANTLGDLISQMFSSPPRPLAELAPDVPPEVCDWIHRCLSLEPEGRPESAGVLLEGLDAAFASAKKSTHGPTAFAETVVPRTQEAAPAPSPVRAVDTAAATNAPAAAPRKKGALVATLAAASLFLVAAIGVVAWIIVERDEKADPTAIARIGAQAKPPAPMPGATEPMMPATNTVAQDAGGADADAVTDANVTADTGAETSAAPRTARRATQPHPGSRHLPGRLIIRSPERVLISLDGRELGSTPQSISIPAGEHWLEGRWPDGHRQRKRIIIRPGEHRRFDLRAAPPPQPIP